jgi:hypothetical protein
MTLRSSIAGTYTLEGLRSLSRPIAWSAHVDPAIRKEQEEALAELVEEADQALNDSCEAVEIEAGQIVGIVYLSPEDMPKKSPA